MKIKLISTLLLSVFSIGLTSGCLMRHTVTRGGEVVEENYVFKRPLKNTFDRSQ
ncbi:MAG: hypothetical protein H8M99_14835 [Gloeobacteraceae cyanobacterium ES-bin-144]|nr:hypothetical protein [Verrucomicrobiales bacterium]